MHRSTTSSSETLVDVEHLARILGVKRSWVYEAAASGRIPSILVGRYRRFRVSEVLDALTAGAEREEARG